MSNYNKFGHMLTDYEPAMHAEEIINDLKIEAGIISESAEGDYFDELESKSHHYYDGNVDLESYPIF